MKFLFIEYLEKEGTITTAVSSDPDKAFVMFHFLCNAAFGVQHDFKVEWELEGVPAKHD